MLNKIKLAVLLGLAQGVLPASMRTPYIKPVKDPNNPADKRRIGAAEAKRQRKNTIRLENVRRMEASAVAEEARLVRYNAWWWHQHFTA